MPSGWLERLIANAPVATVLGSIPASVGTAQSEGAADEAVLKIARKCFLLHAHRLHENLSKITNFPNG